MTEPTHHGAHTVEAQKQDFLQSKATVAGPFEAAEQAWQAKEQLEREKKYPGCILRVKLKYERIPKPRKGKTS